MFNKHKRSYQHSIWIYLMLTSTLLEAVACIRELRLLGLLSETGVAYKSAGSCLTAITMALDDIGARTDILEDYNLTYKWVDSRCHAGTALFQMFERLKYDVPYQLLLGPPCSIAGEATAQVSYMWNLTQLSPEASSPVLSDRTRFHRFFRTIMPDQKLNIARVALLKEFNWKKVATVHQAREFFSAVTDDFLKRIEGTNISIITQEIFANDPVATVNNLKRHDARIILTAMYEDKARELVCAVGTIIMKNYSVIPVPVRLEAYKVGWYGSKIVWVFTGWYSETFWLIDLDNINCTGEEMTLVVEGAFFTGGLYNNPVDERGIANITASEFQDRYFKHPTYSDKWKATDRNAAALCYDHIWTAALALECTIQTLEKIGHNKTLDKFTYEDGDIGDIIFECMGNTIMIGVSGTTSFIEGADSNKVAQLERIQGKDILQRPVCLVITPSTVDLFAYHFDCTNGRDLRIYMENGGKVGLYRQDKNPSYFSWVKGALRWENGKIPKDSAQIENKEIQLPLSLYVSMVIFGSMGICLSLIILGINVKFRNNRYVKLSSPNINNMLILGCVLCYMAVFFKTAGIEYSAICRARLYCFSLGFTITFGSLFSKTWRVYRIFINKTLSRVQIKDSQLFVVNCVLAAVVLVLLIIWDIVGPQEIKSKFLPKEVYVTDDGTEIRPFVKVCWSEYSQHFTWALFIIQGALLFFGTFLAWQTRHVHVKVLNDSRKIGISIYNVIILSAVGVLLSLLLDDQEILLYGISSGFIIFGTTFTLVFIFVPKIRAVINKVQVETVSTARVGSAEPSRPSISAGSITMGQGTLRSVNEQEQKTNNMCKAQI